MAKNSPYMPILNNSANMKECCKDLSKNLMNPDMEAEYKNTVISKPRKRQFGLCTGAISIVLLVLVIWLTAITYISQMQIRNLNSKLLSLTSELDTIKKTVNDNSLLNSANAYDDEIYADMNEDEEKIIDDNLYDDINKRTQKHHVKSQVDDLEGITSIDDMEDIGDDEDGDDLAGSGNWPILDYDKDSDLLLEKNDIVSDELVGKVLEVNVDNKEKKPSGFNELRKVLNDENKANKFDAGRIKRESSYKNNYNHYQRPIRYSIQPLRYSARPDALSFTTDRSIRDSGGESAQTVSAHFWGNISHMRTGTHNHLGNGKVKFADEEVHAAWSPAHWNKHSQSNINLIHEGHIEVTNSGIYFVYAQIFYHDARDESGWIMYRKNASKREPLLQCSTTSITQSSETKDKSNTCFSATVLHLNSGDKIAVMNIGGTRHVIMHKEKSFIGLFKLSDAPNEF